jgi:ABC-type branched-subunit amino acid transport system ATPase component
MLKQVDRQYLEVKNVNKDFGGLRAINNLSIEVRKGELLSIIGPNGAGKTTLLNLITGTLPVSSGEVWFKEQRIDRIPTHLISGLGIARSFQNIQLFSNMSVLENVMMGCHRWMRSTLPEIIFFLGRPRREQRDAFERAMEKLVLFGLEKKANEMPSTLALKERKFLGIARALATDPELLLLDEPVGGLTVEEINEVSEKILKMQEDGLTILFIEHRMELVMGISERVVVMNLGQKIAEGTFDEIQRNERVITAYLGKGIDSE